MAEQNAARPREGPGLTLTEERIEGFLGSLLAQGRTPDTIAAYRRNLTRLYGLLPEDKQLRQGTLAEIRDVLLESGYSSSTINTCMAAAEGLLAHYGRRELQTGQRMKRDRAIQPELTRSEYLRLLSAARMLGKERSYLLVKVFGTTGLPLHDLHRLTVEAAQAGVLAVGTSILHLPACLQRELLDYAGRERLRSGPLFVTQSKTPMNRSHVAKEIQALGPEAQVAEGKCNPRCLRKLYLSTVAGIRDSVALLVEQTYDRLLDTEQLTIGWGQGEAKAK